MSLFQAARRTSSILALRRFATSEGKQTMPGIGQTISLVSIISLGILGPGMYMLLSRPKFNKE